MIQYLVGLARRNPPLALFACSLVVIGWLVTELYGARKELADHRIEDVKKQEKFEAQAAADRKATDDATYRLLEQVVTQNRELKDRMAKYEEEIAKKDESNKTTKKLISTNTNKLHTLEKAKSD